MIEKTVIKYLSEKLKPVPVLMEYPEKLSLEAAEEKTEG